MNSAPGTPRAARPAKKRVMNGPLRNIVWALLLTMAVVVVIGVGFFDVGSQQDLERTTVPNAQTDVPGSAERAQDLAAFPVAAPEVEGWTARGARFSSSPDERWQVRYTSPSGVLVTLLQAESISADAQGEAVPGMRETDTFVFDALPCVVLEGSGESEGTRAVRCDGEGFGLLVHGDAERTELEELMAAALTSADAVAQD